MRTHVIEMKKSKFQSHRMASDIQKCISLMSNYIITCVNYLKCVPEFLMPCALPRSDCFESKIQMLTLGGFIDYIIPRQTTQLRLLYNAQTQKLRKHKSLYTFGPGTREKKNVK